MIEIITYPLIFIFVWFTMCGLWHELMHALECKRQHCTDILIHIRFTLIPSMYYTHTGGYNDTLKYLSGGIYTSILSFIMVFLTTGFWQWCFLTIGFVQFFYGLYEGFYGVKYRYLIYIAVIIVMMLIWILL